MTDLHDHSDCVDAWLHRRVRGRSPAETVDAFEEVYGALWQRAHRTLGGVTLVAIVDRVLHNCAEAHPLLQPLAVGPAGLVWARFRETAQRLSSQEISEALRSGLVEFLEVLGSLTAEILTPALHAELQSRAESPDLETATKDGA